MTSLPRSTVTITGCPVLNPSSSSHLPLSDPVLGSGSSPVGDVISAMGGEFISNAVKDEVNEKKK